ncbi:MAG TPA: metal ABC transporter substrate-binding protein [Anaerolineae bacterium]|nr:metal ABC transporter substrate-binding protein [Anaerolineae bacterium]
MKRIALVWVIGLALAACQPTSQLAQSGGGSATLKVIAAETFLADIAQNVAGDRVKVESLMPIGVDPHGFEPTPTDVAKIADSTVLIVNGAGLEEFLARLLENAGGQHAVLEASAGLTSRQLHEGEIADPDHAGDPHFWLDPNNVIKYVENIRDGLSAADPEGAATYEANAEAYIAKLKELDRWIADRVKEVPQADRLLVTNHESLGYFADRYGFKIIGTVVPSVSSDSAPSALQLAQLIDHIKATGAKAIFLETGTNPQLAEQVAQETGSKVVTDLYSHSITGPDGPAPTYIDMMKHNINAIVDALK